MQLCVIMPAFNEEAALPSVLDDWLAVLNGCGLDYALHVYDDGSTDGTGALLDDYARRHPRVVAHHQTNRGHGPTILAAYCDQADAEWLFQTDADGEMAAEHFPRLWALRENHDLVMARRTHREQPWMRRVLTRGARWCARQFSNGAASDTNVPFRLMRAEAFRPAFHLLPDRTFAPNVLLVAFAARRGLRACELDLAFRARRGPPHPWPLSRTIRNAARCAGDAAVFYARLMRVEAGHV
jgi:glycosyltransferase involved in cell wall biosynthesis